MNTRSQGLTKAVPTENLKAIHGAVTATIPSGQNSETKPPMPYSPSPADIDQMVELDRTKHESTHQGSTNPFDPVERKKTLLAEIEAGCAVVSVSRKGQIASYFIYRPVPGEIWDLTTLRIHPDHRDSGMYKKIAGEILVIIGRDSVKTMRAAVEEADPDLLDSLAQFGIKESERDAHWISLAPDETIFRGPAGHQAKPHKKTFQP